jgi:hypothetical protein
MRTEEQTDGQTIKLVVAFGNFAEHPIRFVNIVVSYYGNLGWNKKDNSRLAQL